MADPAILAEALTLLLAQALPALLAAGRKAAGKAVEEVGEKAGEAGFEKAKAIWSRLSKKEKVVAAATDLAETPADADALAALRLQLKKLLATDAGLAGELAELVGTLRPNVTQVQAQGEAVVAAQGGIAAREIAVGRDINGNVIVINAGAGPMDPAVLEWLGTAASRRDLEAAGRRYLSHLVERYRYLEFRGMGVNDRLPLRLALLEMYIPLKARVQTPEGETWQRLRVAGRRPTEEEADAMGRSLSEPRPVLDLLRDSQGLVLLGDPGSGKTTFLKFLALLLASGQGGALGLGERLPILVPLSAYAEALTAGDVSLNVFIPRHYRERGLDLHLDALLGRALAEGKALLLLDGLDEVRELSRRNLVVERVKDFYSFHKEAGNKLVLTSRIVGYREVRPEAPGLAEATLVDFEEEEIAEFVGKWTAAVEQAASGDTPTATIAATREREELLACVRRSPGVAALAANPLLLTILALMKRQGVDLPERRVELYQTYVETLLRHWNVVRGLGGRSAHDLDVKETLKTLEPLALWMQETSPGRGLVKEWDLHQELERIYRERGLADPEVATRHFLEDVREHAALLLDRGGRQYGFIHLTFQEYLAAAALAHRGQQGVGPIVEALSRRVGDADWREVSLLAIGYLGIVQRRDEAASDVVLGLLDRAPGAPGEAAVLAGLAVADAGAVGVTPACRERVVATLGETMRNPAVAARRRAAAGRALADLGDPRPGIADLDAMELCLVPAGPFRMGSAEDDKEAWDDEKPGHVYDIPYDYYLSRYPVTVAQFRAYVEASGNPPGDPDSLRGPANAPVTWVSWDEALAFCDWQTERLRAAGRLAPGWRVCLPSEAEWEKAARGGLEVLAEPRTGGIARPPEGSGSQENPRPMRRFPWGDEADPERANYDDTGIDAPSSVGCFPGGASPYGCEEMSGNVWEWTRSLWGKSIEKPSFAYPYEPFDGREDLEAPPELLRVLRGGSFIHGSGLVRCAVRLRLVPTFRNGSIGFRVVFSPFSSGL